MRLPSSLADEEDDLRRIEKAAGKRLPRVTVPDFDCQARPAPSWRSPMAQRIAEIAPATPGSGLG